jgi:hypothetical protein
MLTEGVQHFLSQLVERTAIIFAESDFLALAFVPALSVGGNEVGEDWGRVTYQKFSEVMFDSSVDGCTEDEACRH